MPILFDFDFKKPDYVKVFKHRLKKLDEIRRNPSVLPDLKKFYKENIAQFIIDWGTTSEPRNIDRGLPADIPLLLFPKQEEFVWWLWDRWKARDGGGIVEKSRDMGATHITVAFGASLCLFYDGIVIKYGSRKEEYVDSTGDPKALLYKARKFVSMIPKEFRGDWNVFDKKNSSYMRIRFPITDAVMTGEAGDNIGRGDRGSLVCVDESAYIAHPKLVDAALSETSNCTIHSSTPNGRNNTFAEKRFSGKVPVFTLHWRDDPRKDEEWYKKRCEYYDDPVMIAQELDIDYSASITGIIIPSEWVQAAIDAHLKLKIEITGKRLVGLDIADGGVDKNAMSGTHGILLEHLVEWSGIGSDIFRTIENTILECDLCGYSEVYFDADGLGASARGDSRVINERRRDSKLAPIEFRPFIGSGGVIDPEHDVFTGKKIVKMPHAPVSNDYRANKDFFENRKAQAWWSLAKRFKLTYRAVVEKKEFNPDELISISSKLPLLNKLMVELSQPTYMTSKTGKIMVDKNPNSKSPNLADSTMIAYAPKKLTAQGVLSSTRTLFI